VRAILLAKERRLTTEREKSFFENAIQINFNFSGCSLAKHFFRRRRKYEKIIFYVISLSQWLRTSQNVCNGNFYFSSSRSLSLSTHILTRVMQLNMKEFLLTFHFMSSLRPFLLMKDFQEPPKESALLMTRTRGEKKMVEDIH
jgi:hypothetical protein